MPRLSDAGTPEAGAVPASEATIEASYYTDPLCSWSWGFEPQWRRLRYEFGGQLAWRTRMGGLLPGWDRFSDPVQSVSRPLQMGPVCVEVRHLTGQPLDDRIWVDDPPESSFPACLAVKAAELQSAEAGEQMLRRIREAAMLERRNVARDDVLLELAGEVSAQAPELLDVERFEIDFDGEASTAFRQDLQEARYLGIGRFPALTLRQVDGDGPTLLLVGHRPYDVLRRAVVRIAPGLEPVRQAPDPEEYAAFWGGATEREIAEVLESGSVAPVNV